MTSKISTVLLILLAINTLWFVAYAAQLGLAGLTADQPATVSRVYTGTSAPDRIAMAIHMVAGGLLTVLAPLQALPIMRHRWNALHRRSGFVIALLAMLTGIGGLAYILQHGTIGGWWMSLWFAIYGLAIMICAAQTILCARAKNMRQHFIWATRLVILAVGSWIYRMHYAIWYALTDGAASRPDFTGLFDLIQVFAFFVPYLLLAELFLRRLPQTYRP